MLAIMLMLTMLTCSFADTLSRTSIPGDEKSGPEFETINMMKFLTIFDEQLN